MKIVVASKGRSHLLDCSRVLQNLGHNVTFYTATPRKNFKKYGLLKGGISFAEILAPIIILSIYFPSNFTRGLFSYALDLLVALSMPKCDVFIASSPDFTWSMKLARKRWGTLLLLDRGASHVRLYNEMSILSGSRPMTEWYMTQDESQYALADYIALGSDYMQEGFIAQGVDKRKLFSNPYGVSFKDFPPTTWTGEFDFIYVGQWSKRKGGELIIDALRGTKYRFLHVGSIIDIDFPNESNFTHFDSVPQSELFKFYAKAKVFLFPSYDDGFGMVLCQAYSCGLPIVCSQNCGGTTMKRLIPDSDNIIVLNEMSSICLRDTCKELIEYIGDPSGVRSANYEKLESFSWESYGNRLNSFLEQVLELRS